MQTQHNLLQPDSSSPPISLFRMITGYWVSQCVYVAAKLGIADLIAEGPKTAEDLARATGTHPQSLYRLLRGLTAAGIFTETESRSFQLNAAAQCLQGGVAGSLRDAAIMYGEEWYAVWGRLLHTVQTGETTFDSVFGQGLFEYYREHADAAEIFSRGMTALSRTAYPNQAIIAAYDFSAIHTMVDVGGGHGDFLADVLRACPGMRGILFDLPHVTEGANSFLRQAGLDPRCTFAAGDFFQAVPEGGDACFLKRILHDWDDARAIAILKNCHKAMKPGGKLLVVEIVIPEGNTPSFGKLLDLHMMVLTGGVERTESEYRALFSAAGFSLNKITHTESPISVIEGARIP